MKAWRAHRYGAPVDVLQLDELEAPAPGAGELQIRVTSVTLNFNDIDGIRGRYRTVPTPVPYVPGMEVLGIVESCGAGAAGVRVIATAGSADKLALCRTLGAELAIEYRSTDFVSVVNEATSGRGIDVAFDTVGGDVTRQTFRCMAFNGRHVIAGFASGIEGEDEGIVPRPLLFGNFSLLGVCHAYVDDRLAFGAAVGFNFPSHASGTALHERLLAMIGRGTVRPVVGRHVGFGELPAALDAMERRETVGRTVVRVA